MSRARHAAALLVALGAAALPAVPADAATRSCRSSDLRYPYSAGGPEHFGVFRLRADGTGCATARRAARAWMRRFEASLDDGRLELPASAGGFSFTELPPNRPQTYRLRGRRGPATVRFDYVVPNG